MVFSRLWLEAPHHTNEPAMVMMIARMKIMMNFLWECPAIPDPAKGPRE
jgi:hypothetical protein